MRDHFKMQYNNPFIACLFIDDYEYIKFCKNFDNYISLTPTSGEPKENTKWALQNGGNGWFSKENNKYVVIHLGDVELHFIHDTDADKVITSYNRRLKRLKDTTVIFLLADPELHLDYTAEEYKELRKDWDTIPNSIYISSPKETVTADEQIYFFAYSRKLNEFNCYRSLPHPKRLDQLKITYKLWGEFSRCPITRMYIHDQRAICKLYYELVLDLIHNIRDLMLENVITDYTEPDNHRVKSIMFDDCYKIFEVNGVSSYSHYDFTAWKFVQTTISDSPKNFYFIIDTEHRDAFGHWVYESAIYLHLFNKLKILYPTIKLKLDGYKKFKQIFIEYFGISMEDVVYEMCDGENVCFFPSPISAIHRHIITDINKKQIDNFFDSFASLSLEKNNTVLYMPRQHKENLIYNDRIYQSPTIDKFMTENHIVLNTDYVEKLSDQVNTVSGSKTIIVTDGSPYQVNGMFCRDSTIIRIGNMTDRAISVEKQYLLAYIDNKIRVNNKVHCLSDSHEYYLNDIIQWII
jgi:uncharacterized protein (DUF1919 family)